MTIVISTEAEQIKIGEYVMIKERPCIVHLMPICNAGKYGHKICNFIAHDIFNNDKLEYTYSTACLIDVPIVIKIEYTLIDIGHDDYVSLMDSDGNIREDIKLPSYPENYAHKLRSEFNKGEQLCITIIKACNQEQIISHKIDIV